MPCPCKHHPPDFVKRSSLTALTNPSCSALRVQANTHASLFGITIGPERDVEVALADHARERLVRRISPPGVLSRYRRATAWDGLPGCVLRLLPRDGSASARSHFLWLSLATALQSSLSLPSSLLIDRSICTRAMRRLLVLCPCVPSHDARSSGALAMLVALASFLLVRDRGAPIPLDTVLVLPLHVVIRASGLRRVTFYHLLTRFSDMRLRGYGRSKKSHVLY